MLPQIQQILVCTDFSSTSWAALRYGASLSQCHKAQLTLLHVLPTMPQEFTYSGVSSLFDYGPGMASVPPPSTDSSQKGKMRSSAPAKGEKHPGEFVEKAQQVTRDQLQNHLLKLKSKEPDYNWHSVVLLVRMGEPVKTILQETDSQKFDLVVLGKRGHGKHRQRRAGGVAQGVMNNSSIPVLMADKTSTR